MASVSSSDRVRQVTVTVAEVSAWVGTLPGLLHLVGDLSGAGRIHRVAVASQPNHAGGPPAHGLPRGGLNGAQRLLAARHPTGVDLGQRGGHCGVGPRARRVVRVLSAHRETSLSDRIHHRWHIWSLSRLGGGGHLRQRYGGIGLQQYRARRVRERPCRGGCAGRRPWPGG